MVFRKYGARIAPLIMAMATTIGCQSPHTVRTADYAHVSQSLSQAYRDPDPVASAAVPIAAELAGIHPVDDYIRFALTQNPGVQAARSRIEAAANRVPQSASLKDPMLDITGWPITENAPQTASGRMTVDMMVSQEVPWFGKLQTRADAAEAEVNAARAQLAARELETIEQVKRAYYQLHYVEQAIRVTKESRGLFANVIENANARYESGQTSLQDVLRSRAQLSSVDGDLVQLEQELASSRAELAQLLHVSPETPFQTLDELPAEDIPDDIEQLYQRAIVARPELHAMLADIERDRSNVELAHLEYRPDFTFKAGWSDMTTNRAIAPTADGLDNLAAGLMVNLPVYRKRLEAGVREAEAKVVASAREYDQMRDQTLREVKNLFSQVRSQQQLVELFGKSIIPDTRQAFEVSMREYQTGEVGYVQMIDNWRELLRFQLMQQQQEAQLRQSMASLARMVGSYELSTAEAIDSPPSPNPPQPPEN